jgi:hypothetical protein
MQRCMIRRRRACLSSWPRCTPFDMLERDFFIDNLLIHLIIEMILVDRPCAMRV